jgi:hypothetical protein
MSASFPSNTCKQYGDTGFPSNLNFMGMIFDNIFQIALSVLDSKIGLIFHQLNQTR